MQLEDCGQCPEMKSIVHLIQETKACGFPYSSLLMEPVLPRQHKDLTLPDLPLALESESQWHGLARVPC